MTAAEPCAAPAKGSNRCARPRFHPPPLAPPVHATSGRQARAPRDANHRCRRRRTSSTWHAAERSRRRPPSAERLAAAPSKLRRRPRARTSYRLKPDAPATARLHRRGAPGHQCGSRRAPISLRRKRRSPTAVGAATALKLYTEPLAGSDAAAPGARVAAKLGVARRWSDAVAAPTRRRACALHARRRETMRRTYCGTARGGITPLAAHDRAAAALGRRDSRARPCERFSSATLTLKKNDSKRLILPTSAVRRGRGRANTR